jgi:SpoVK/Ycf46/Vps4 family AAA+-type ATPase
MPASTRELLRGLCWKFTSGNPWSADFVQGKGEGNIVLLHGPPGVGKTYTAGKYYTIRVDAVHG